LSCLLYYFGFKVPGTAVVPSEDLPVIGCFDSTAEPLDFENTERTEPPPPLD